MLHLRRSRGAQSFGIFSAEPALHAGSSTGIFMTREELMMRFAKGRELRGWNLNVRWGKLD